MPHHYSGPECGFSRGDARLDLTDVYVFGKPGDAGKSVLVVNMHPSSTIIAPGRTSREPFSPDAICEFRIDTDGDAVADIAYRITVSSSSNKSQTVSVRRAEGAFAAPATGDGTLLIFATPVLVGRDALIACAAEHRIFAGWRSEPFFFDTLGAINGLRFTGSDVFADKEDVCSIVLEVDNSVLGAKPIGLWARVLAKDGDGWVQVERGAWPQQAVFLPGDEREAYLSGEPVDDLRFVATFAHSLEHSGGYAPHDAVRVAKTLLPDMLIYDHTRPTSFPEYGRTLTDDAADVSVSLLTNGKMSGDMVAAHNDLLVEFPYLWPPHLDDKCDAETAGAAR